MQKIILLFTVFFSLIFYLRAEEMVVIESSVSALKEGLIINMDSKISVPDGKTIILITHTGKQHRINGPYAGKVISDKKKPNMVGALKGLITSSEKNTATLGTMRLVKDTNMPSIWMLNPSNEGVWCVKKEKISFWRNNNDSKVLISIKDPKTNKKITDIWHKGENELVLPASQKIMQGKPYLFRIEDSSRSRKLIFAFFPQELENKNKLEQAAWMIKKGCKKQARKLLEK
jgi:hypothetical protein